MLVDVPPYRGPTFCAHFRIAVVVSNRKPAKMQKKPVSRESAFVSFLRHQARIQLRQTKTNVCQCLVPVVLLLFLMGLSRLLRSMWGNTIPAAVHPPFEKISGGFLGNASRTPIPYCDISGPNSSVGLYYGYADRRNEGMLGLLSADGVKMDDGRPLRYFPPWQRLKDKDAIDALLYEMCWSDHSVMTAAIFLRLDNATKNFSAVLYYK